MQGINPRFDRAQVLVAGDLMLDRYWYGDTGRISPEAPVPVIKVGQLEDRVGGAGNVALNIASLGAGATLVGAVGRDEAARSIVERLHAAGIRTEFQESADKPTITKLRVISRQQQLLRLDFEETYGAEDVDQLAERTRSLLPDVSVLILSDYAKGTLQDPQTLVAAAIEAGVKVLVDPKGADFRRYRGATLLTPNLNEFESVVGVCDDEQTLLDRGLDLLAELELEALLITRGEQDMTLLRQDHSPLHLPARAREVFDVTGAGDTVIAVLGAALAAGESLDSSVTLANLAAGIVVGKLGTATVSGPELRRAVLQEQGSERGVVNEQQLLVDIADARARGEKLVFTNGCFDILHAGHVGYLEQARKLGDRLIVAVNADESVSRLKGPGRPINPAERRMAVLAGLEAVDWVLCFADDTPERLLSLIQPDILVKGGDYAREQVVGWEVVEAYGGEVKALDFLDDCSTTAIVAKIQGDQPLE